MPAQVSDWMTEQYQPRVRRDFRRTYPAQEAGPIGPVSSGPPPTVSVDMWYTTSGVPQSPKDARRTYPAQGAMGEFPLPPALVTTSVDMWYSVPQTPQFPKTWHQLITWLGRDNALISLPTGATFTDWSLERYIERPKSWTVYQSSVNPVNVTLPAEVITLDKWFTLTAIPVKRYY